MFSSRVALIVPVGLGDTTKSDDFLKKKSKGGRSFSIQKFILQILVLYIVFLDGFRKKSISFSRKAVWNCSENSSDLVLFRAGRAFCRAGCLLFFGMGRPSLLHCC